MPTNMLNECEFWMIVLCIFLAIRDLVWKAIALYKAWQKSDKVRFIFIFIFNTCGILPIIYLILSRKKKH
jgi:hypothetical protein